MKIKKLNDEQEKIVCENLGLVRHIAKGFENLKEIFEFEDLVAIGTIGLIKAVQTFDESKNTKKATYFCKCIKNEILMYVRREKKHRVVDSFEKNICVDSEGNNMKLVDVLSTEEKGYNNIYIDDTFENLINVIINLNDKKSRTVILYMLAGVQQKEIADILHISQSYVSRLEKKLCEKLMQCAEKRKKYIGVYRGRKIEELYQFEFLVEKDNSIIEKTKETLRKNAIEEYDLKLEDKVLTIKLILCENAMKFL